MTKLAMKSGILTSFRTPAIITMIIIFSISGNSQSIPIGIKAGYNNSDLEYIGGNVYHSKSGVYAGVFTSCKISKKLKLQPEMVLTCEGAKSSIYKVALKYINLPILLKLPVISNFNLYAGIQPGLSVSAKYKYVNFEEPEKSTYKTIAFSYVFGIGYESKKHFGIETRYCRSIGNIRKPGYAEQFSGVFQIGLFYSNFLQSKKK